MGKTRRNYRTWKKPAPPPIPKFYSTKKWRALHRMVLKRDNKTCQYCGQPGFQADHVIPRRKGGPDALPNLVCCCRQCNVIAGGRKFLSFDQKREWIRARRGLT